MFDGQGELLSVVAIIPARYASTRFPGKPLAADTGKPLIQHVYENVRAAARVDRVIVATDDERISQAVRAFDGEVAMTRADHPSGTDRIAEVATGLDAELVINVQGDEPELDPAALDGLIARMAERPDAAMGSLACRFTNEADVLNPACVKVVLNGAGDALYFSRSLIPYPRDAGGRVASPENWLLHLGVYAFRPAFLKKFTATPPTPLEQTEQLEQLRALHLGETIAMAIIDRHSTGIDTPEQYADFVKRYKVSPQNKGPRQFIAVSSRGESTPGQRNLQQTPWKVNRHTPPHLLLDDTWYLISASTSRGVPYFRVGRIAAEMCEQIERWYARFDWKLERFVVMPDHYHVVAYSRGGQDLPLITQRLHGRMSKTIRAHWASTKGAKTTKFFNNYWDKCLNTEKEYLEALEYVRLNPVSAGLVCNEEAWQYAGPRDKLVARTSIRST